MVNAETIGTLYAGHQWQWQPGRMKQGYELCLRVFGEAGLEPNRIVAKAPHVAEKYRDFMAIRPTLERSDFDQVKYFTIVHLAQGGFTPGYEWGLYWSMICDRELMLGAVPCFSANASAIVSCAFRTWAEMCQVRYGYCFHQQMKFGPVYHCLGVILHVQRDSRHDDLTMNTSWWSGNAVGASPYLHGLLRDVYPESYLSQPYLDARLGRSRTTLKEWIEADPARRGSLKPYTDILTKWTPPVEKIPQIREELFRAGRVYFWQFFCPPGANEQPGPFFRPELSTPWEAPEPIPDIYRADYWKDKDPSLTY